MNKNILSRKRKEPQDRENLFDWETVEWLQDPPRWILRWGIVGIFCISASIFFISFYISYPDVVVMSTQLIRANPPVRIVSQVSSKLVKLFVNDNDFIKEGKLICVLDNQANYEDILKLKKVILFLERGKKIYAINGKMYLPQEIQVGDLQNTYTDLYQNIVKYRFFKNHRFYEGNLRKFDMQTQLNKNEGNQLEKETNLLNQEQKIIDKSFYADSILYTKRVISLKEYEEGKRRWLDQKMKIYEQKNKQLQTRLHGEELTKSMFNLNEEKTKEEELLFQAISEFIGKLKGELSTWESKYLIVSPIDGTVTLTKYRTVNEFVTKGDIVVIISPTSTGYLGFGRLPISRSGMVNVGDKVLIKLYAYPFEEFGIIIGRVDYISPVAQSRSYSVKVSLPKGLTTSIGKRIKPLPELEGQGEIITARMSFFERIIKKVQANTL